MTSIPHSAHRLGLVVAIVVTGTMAALAFAIGASAQPSPDLELPLTVVLGEPGSEHELVRSPIPAGLVGRTCVVTATAANNSSVHLGNQLIVTSGGAQIPVADVERASGASTTADAPLTLGTEIVVELVLGEDGVFSAGTSVLLECSASGPVVDDLGPTPTEAPPTTVDTQVLPAVAQPPEPVLAQPTFTG